MWGGKRMLEDIKTVLALLDKVRVEGSASVKALGAAMCRLESMRTAIEQARAKKEGASREHSHGDAIPD